MGMCWSCFCTPVCCASGSACACPAAFRCCGTSGIVFLEHPATFVVAGVFFLLGLILHGLMTTACAKEAGIAWNPFPWVYSGTSCFSEGGNVEHFSYGFWSALFIGVSFPFLACATWAHATKKRRDEEFQLQLERYAQLGLNPHLQHSPAAVALAMQAHQQAQGFVHPPGPQTGHFPAHFPPYPTAPPVTLVAEVDGANAAAWANEAGASGAGASEAGAGASEAGTSGGKRGGGGS